MKTNNIIIEEKKYLLSIIFLNLFVKAGIEIDKNIYNVESCKAEFRYMIFKILWKSDLHSHNKERKNNNYYIQNIPQNLW